MFLTVSDQSSTVLQILLRINIYYTIFWFILEIPLFIFKYYNIPYGTSAFGIEMTMIFMLCLNEFLRQYFGIKGNLMLNNTLIIIFILYGFFSAIGFIFFLVLQSHTQRIEILLSAIGLTLITIEILFSIITFILNRRAMPILTKQEKIKRIKEAQEQFQLLLKNE
ncbi:unnamed protein product [Rotaria sp. Silwood1]|nr:unnamed protein product [Rotaria sp. Silwood1]CAF1135333.1 unnamed protein product [Rotaria sp. Silwood1]CAF3448450.1 unnamed protein product [Rotaria sp. Silwood1]CAF3473412.1 unnamed protein product [Rotaria sp. Silwood1]CAF3480365.1 unnamed protein product [Rotaria sp. Silwood1]